MSIQDLSLSQPVNELGVFQTFSIFILQVRSLGYDYVDDDSNPFPIELSGQREDHGTSCAGEIAMVKNNGVCGVGVAYQSSITGGQVEQGAYEPPHFAALISSW